jgi:hypothetical protein
MCCRTTWSIAGLAGAALLLLGLGSMWAQRPLDAPRVPQPPFGPGPGMGMGPHPGRFSVAHASEKRIVILDTATGKLYQAKESDLLPYADLPKFGEAGRPPRGDGRDRDRDRRREEDKERVKERQEDRPPRE